MSKLFISLLLANDCAYICHFCFRAVTNEEHINKLHFNPYVLRSHNIEDLKSYSLYPYSETKMAVMFVYGADFQRKHNILLIPITIKIATILITSFMCVAAIVLHKMRKTFKWQRVGLSLAFVDVIIAFIGCGNLRVRHKLERWFFAILLIGAVFMTPIFAGELLKQVYLMHDQEITTFAQLEQIKSPIFINPALSLQVDGICERLRLVSMFSIEISLQNMVLYSFQK